ncbi:hypothetical protein [Cellvibrio sp. PSBB006]|uniref:alpha-glutamyl/putrescinyl thymine pyrophosphorylase clade 3 protein n=1 Tax=Cellvibrio sp. PSBB006 TaxID=1987723 RepID=UPI000B3B6DAA|nr:hypothetical protein [Cellvibrio sp. PSBB006]ARU28669.1 hypothetical protein CBR65_15120 [Cellvibrio sp. PSBB006]
MRTADLDLYNLLSSQLENHVATVSHIPILEEKAYKDAFIRQLIDSIRRVKYVTITAEKNYSLNVADPYVSNFNPLKAALYHFKNNNLDEAVWLIFISTHFGKSKKSGWLLTQDFYKGPNQNSILTWERVKLGSLETTTWIDNLKSHLANKAPKRVFGNHRKYESLRPDSKRPLNKVIASYISLIESHQTHENLFSLALIDAEGSKYNLFDNLYKKFRAVLSFGRTGSFDFLTMLGKLKILNAEPPKTYINQSTGPRDGCGLLFGNKSSAEYENEMFKLSESLSINPFGMQVLEDAICNWQKSPDAYTQFRG